MMAKHSYERARFNRREARQRTPFNGWVGWIYGAAVLPSDQWSPEDVQRVQRRLSRTIHSTLSSGGAGLSRFTRRYRKLWRSQSKLIARLHRDGRHDQAEDLDPQPKRLGVMRDIW